MIAPPVEHGETRDIAEDEIAEDQRPEQQRILKRRDRSPASASFSARLMHICANMATTPRSASSAKSNPSGITQRDRRKRGDPQKQRTDGLPEDQGDVGCRSQRSPGEPHEGEGEAAGNGDEGRHGSGVAAEGWRRTITPMKPITDRAPAPPADMLAEEDRRQRREQSTARRSLRRSSHRRAADRSTAV